MVFLKGLVRHREGTSARSKRVRKVHGRLLDILNFGSNGFLLTDDCAGVVYYIYEKQ